MSIKVMSALWDSGPQDKTALLVLLALADFCDDDGVCFPSIRRIAEKCRMTERGAQKAIRKMESDGWLTIKTGNGRHGTNVYKIHTTPNDIQGVNSVQGEQECKKPRTRVQETLNGGSPEPSVTIKEPSVSEILGGVASQEVAADFIEHRRQMKKPLTVMAAKRMAKRLAESSDPDAVLSLSIENGWQGVFPDKVQKRPAPQGGAQPFFMQFLTREQRRAG